MLSLQHSQHADGSLEMDELEELLRDEDFEERDSASDGSEEVIYHHHHSQLSYRQKRYLQSLPTNSVVRQIVKRWQDEGSTIPVYIFWPWSFIRNFIYGIFLVGWFAITLAAFWPVFHMMFFPQSCVESDASVSKWLDGTIVQTDLDPDQSLTVWENKVKLKSLNEYNVRFIYLSSSAWWSGFLSTNQSRSRSVGDKIHGLSDACRIYRIKIMMGVFVSNNKELLEVHKRQRSRDERNASSVADDSSKHGTMVEVFHSLVAAGISGFYVEDSDELSPEEMDKLLNTFKVVQDDNSSTEIMFGMNDNSAVTLPPVTFAGSNLNQMAFSSAANLSKWIDSRYENDSQPWPLWKMSSVTVREDEGAKDNYAYNLRLLQTVLPGIPMLSSTDFEDPNNSASVEPKHIKTLLSLRKHSLALQEREFSLLEEGSHLGKNVFAMLRTFEEEKRYLVLWNFSNLNVSLNFHLLSFEGRWVFRSVVSEYKSVFRMRSIENLHPFEFGLIELP